MSYRRTWAKRFFADELKIDAEAGWGSPYRDSQHLDPDTGRSICITCAATPGRSAGWSTLLEKIDIRAVMPGDLHKIIGFSVKGLYELGFGTIISTLLADVKLKGDGAQIWRSPSNLVHENNQWALNSFHPNIPIGVLRRLLQELFPGPLPLSRRR